MEQYIPKSAILAEIEKLVDKGKYHEEFDCAYRDGNNGALYALKDKLDTLEVKEVDLQEEQQVKETAEIERDKETCKENGDSLTQEPVSEDLGEYINELSKQFPEVSFAKLSRIAVRVANWQKEHLWKPADGDDLPEYEREVIVLIKYYAQRNIHDKEYSTYRVGFGHRPNPDGWDGKNIDTNEVTHYTPKLYDKGGWNVPDIVYWLDVKLPKEIEEL